MSCDREIFANGHCLVTLMEQPGPMPNATVDRICARLTECTEGKVRFDWHPMGGRPYLLYLGDYELAKQAYLKESAYIQKESSDYYHAWYAENPDMAPHYDKDFKSTLGVEEGIYAPKMKTTGQLWHA